VNVELIQYVPLFADLSEADLALIAGAFRLENRSRGTIIFNSGETAHTLYLVEAGFVRLISENGTVLATLGPGSLLGEAEFLRGTEHVMSAVTAGDVHLQVLTEEALRKLFQKHPNIGVLLSRTFGEQLVQMEDYLAERLAATDLLGQLPANVLQILASRLQPYEVPASSMLFRSGEQARGLYLLESGVLELRSGDSSNSPQTLEPGEVFGALPLLTHKPHTNTAWAVEDTLVWMLSVDDFYRISAHFPSVRRTLGRRLRSKLSPADQTQAVIRLAQTPIFATMGPQNLQAIAQRLVLQHAPAGEPIFRAGDSGDALYLVEDGEVELTIETDSGVVQEIDRVEVGGYCGEMSLLTGKNHTYDATAIRDTNLWVLYKADLDELVSLHPGIGATLNQVVAAKLVAEEEIIEEGRYRRFPLLANLSARDLREVVRYLQPTRYRSGEQIYRAGSPGTMLYLIESGYVRMQPQSGGNGWTLNPGEIFGERAVLTNQLTGQTAYAETEVDLLTISREDLETVMMRVPGLAMSLSRLISQRANEGASLYNSEGVAAEAGQGPITLSSQRRRTASQPGVEPEQRRLRLGEWFSGLSTGAKLRLVLLLLILTYLFTVAAWASLNTLINGPTVAAGSPQIVSASMLGVVEAGNRVDQALAARSAEGGLIALAEGDNQATPTYTPYPTNTAIPTNTPTVTPIPTDTAVPPTPTFTPVPPTAVVAVAQVQEEAAPAEPEARTASAAPSRVWDSRLDALGVRVADAGVGSGQPYWRLIEARWEDEAQAGGKHHIYVEVLDETGQRVTGQPVTIFWGDGSDTVNTENKPAPEFASNYPMYKAGNSYNVKVEGLPSDVIEGLGLGTPGDHRFFTIHTNFLLTFQKTIAP
jgi:CRP-like cAMP-binding protein